VPTKEAIWILDLLEEAVELCGVPHDLMTDNGTPFVAIARTMLTRFRTLEDLRIRHIRTQIDTPWTNGKVEAFWATLQREVLDRQQFADPGGRRGRRHRLRELLQLPSPPRRGRLAHAWRALRRDALHRPRIRKRAGSGRCGRPSRRYPRRVMASLIFTGELQLGVPPDALFSAPAIPPD